MRRRSAPPPSAQQMIRDYLGRVSVAATKVLPKGDRLLFVGRTRAAIEAQVGPLASADADDVLSALATLGDPEDLAKRERERLYSARRRGAAAAPPALWKPAKGPAAGGCAATPADGRDPGQAHKPRPWPHRGLAGADVPKAAAGGDAPQPDAVPVVPRQAGSPEATAPPQVPPADPAEWVPREPARKSRFRACALRTRPSGSRKSRSRKSRSRESWSRTGRSPGSRRGRAGAGAAPDEAGPDPGRPRRAGCAPAPPAAGRRDRAAVDRPGHGGAHRDGRTPAEGPAPPAPAVLAEAWALARKHPLEAVSVILLGVGGLILPFPFWLIGGLVALRSRRWDARDKWIALAGPPLVTFAVLLIRAGTSPGNFFSAFYHASQHDVGLSIRAGCVLCAGYLVWRLAARPADADASSLAASPLTYAGRDR